MLSDDPLLFGSISYFGYYCRFTNHPEPMVLKGGVSVSFIPRHIINNVRVQTHSHGVRINQRKK